MLLLQYGSAAAHAPYATRSFFAQPKHFSSSTAISKAPDGAVRTVESSQPSRCESISHPVPKLRASTEVQGFRNDCSMASPGELGLNAGEQGAPVWTPSLSPLRVEQSPRSMLVEWC